MSEYIENGELQRRLLHIMKLFHKFCEENNLHYYMIGGTLLGAVRHKGFIPWDDDADLGMPREDYEKMISLSNELPKELSLMFYRNKDQSPMHFAKIVDNTTTLIEKHYHNYVEGLYIDVFPLDNVLDFSNRELRRVKKIRRMHSLVIAHCTTDRPDSLSKRLYNVCARVLSLNWLHASIDKEMTIYSSQKTEFVMNILGAYGAREWFSRTDLLNGKLLEFEDTAFWAPGTPELFLESAYGDYMKLPPLEEQVPKHDFYYLDLNTSYTEYKSE